MFSGWLREVRRGLGLTQGALAEALGVSASAVGMWERGERLPGAKAAARLTCWLAERGIAPPPRPWRLGPPRQAAFRRELEGLLRGRGR